MRSHAELKCSPGYIVTWLALVTRYAVPRWFNYYIRGRSEGLVRYPNNNQEVAPGEARVDISCGVL